MLHLHAGCAWVHDVKASAYTTFSVASLPIYILMPAWHPHMVIPMLGWPPHGVHCPMWAFYVLYVFLLSHVQLWRNHCYSGCNVPKIVACVHCRFGKPPVLNLAYHHCDITLMPPDCLCHAGDHYQSSTNDVAHPLLQLGCVEAI